MAAIIPGYEYDIFISYRQNDNKRDAWVTNFVAALKDELEATLKNPVSIYFDENPHDGLLETHQVGASLEKKLKCLVLIPIISQTYCDTTSFAWQYELLPFIKIAKGDELGMNITLANGNVTSRVLPIKIHDLDTEDLNTLETVLDGPLRSIDFIYQESGVNRPLLPTDSRDLNLEKSDYRNQVNKLANALKEIGTSIIKSSSKIEGEDANDIISPAANRQTGLPSSNKKPIWQKLRESKNYGIIIILMTLFFGLTFREFLSFGLTRLNISPVWSDIFLYTILLFLPTMATLLFIPRDKSRFLRRARRLIPPVNILAAAVTLVIMFWGRDLGAMTTIVTYEDGQGNSREVTVLKNEFVTALLTYPFEPKNDNADSLSLLENQWLNKGIPLAINQNLQQFKSISNWVGGEDRSLKEKFEQLEYEADYLLLGKYERTDDSLVVDIQLYNSQAKIFHEQTLKTTSLFEMSDAIKQVLLDKLAIHPSAKTQADLPFTAFVTDNEKAFKHWASGNNRAAIREDPDYAYAYLSELYHATRYGWGDIYKIQLAEDGLDRLAKLPEQDQLRFRAFYFLAKGEKEKALMAYERFVEFNPGDQKVIFAYIRFLRTNGYEEKALEISWENFSKTFDIDYGEILYELTLLLGDAEELDQLKKEVKNVKILLPDLAYLIVMGTIDFWRGDLTSARSMFQEVLIEKPKYYTLDSLIKVIDFMEEVDKGTLKEFGNSITGTYLAERGDQLTNYKFENGRLKMAWGGQVPQVVYQLDENSIYWCNPFSDRQYQVKEIFSKGVHGQIFKIQHNQQNSPDVEAFTRYYYKASPELLEAMDAFRSNDYDKADSLFRIVYQYDSGYYFVRNFIDAIKFSSDEDAFKLAKLLHGKRLKGEKNKEVLDFSYNDDVLQFKPENGVPQTIYPVGDNWLMDAYNKENRWKVLNKDDNLSIELHKYNRDEGGYRFVDTYILVK